MTVRWGILGAAKFAQNHMGPAIHAAKGAELAALEAAHRALHQRILDLDDVHLDEPVVGSDPTVRGMLFGVLQHNAYHAGQIALLCKRP